MVSASAIAPTAQTPAKRWKVRATPNEAVAAPAQPCDFRRAYRGTIGKTRVSYVLGRSDKKPGVLTGWVHYDKEGPATPVSGRVADDGSFTLEEKPGGQLRGSCDANGVLTGTFVLDKKSESFQLTPFASGAPGHYRVSRHLVSEPNHPACRGKVRPDQIVVLDGPAPPADDPDRWIPPIYCMTAAFRQQLSADGGADFRCIADDSGLRLFGMRDAAVEKRINRLLRGTDYERSVAATKPCSGGVSSASGTWLTSISADALVFEHATSAFFSGATGPGLSEPSEPMIVDLKTGATSKLGDTVELDKLAAVLSRCLPIYLRAWRVDTDAPPSTFELPPQDALIECDEDGFLWGCEGPYNRSTPTWSLVPEGVVISRGIIPSIAHGLEGAGPIVSWAVLAREGALRDTSPLASLYRGVVKAPAEALPCTSAFSSRERLDWSPVIDGH